jgi:hypothetical protein
MDIGADGVYWFKTEMPGDESVSGWGKDNKPHMHFDIICDGCAASKAFDGHFQYWNKFYPLEICTVDGCGDASADNQATLVSPGVYKYDIVIFGDGK